MNLSISSELSKSLVWANPIGQTNFTVMNNGNAVAIIDRNGVFRCQVDPNDETAKQFVDCIEREIGRRLTAIVATEKTGESNL